MFFPQIAAKKLWMQQFVSTKKKMDMTLGMIVITCACYSIFHMKLAIKLSASILFLDDTIKMSTKTTTKEKKASNIW